MEKHISYVFLLKKKHFCITWPLRTIRYGRKTFRLFFYFKKTFALHGLWGPFVTEKTFRLFFYFKNCLHYIVFEDHSLRRTKHFVDFQIKKNCAIQPFVMGKTCRVFFYLKKKKVLHYMTFEHHSVKEKHNIVFLLKKKLLHSIAFDGHSLRKTSFLRFFYLKKVLHCITGEKMKKNNNVTALNVCIARWKFISTQHDIQCIYIERNTASLSKFILIL